LAEQTLPTVEWLQTTGRVRVRVSGLERFNHLPQLLYSGIVVI